MIQVPSCFASKRAHDIEWSSMLVTEDLEQRLVCQRMESQAVSKCWGQKTKETVQGTERNWKFLIKHWMIVKDWNLILDLVNFVTFWLNFWISFDSWKVRRNDAVPQCPPWPPPFSGPELSTDETSGTTVTIADNCINPDPRDVSSSLPWDMQHINAAPARICKKFGWKQRGSLQMQQILHSNLCWKKQIHRKHSSDCSPDCRPVAPLIGARPQVSPG